MPPAMTRYTVKCANPSCKRFICTIHVYADMTGKIAKVADIKCRKCKHLTEFEIVGVDSSKQHGTSKS